MNPLEKMLRDAEQMNESARNTYIAAFTVMAVLWVVIRFFSGMGGGIAVVWGLIMGLFLVLAIWSERLRRRLAKARVKAYGGPRR